MASQFEFCQRCWNVRIPHAAAKFVYCYLASCLNMELGCFPSLETISEHTGLYRRTVQLAIAELIDHGLIERKPRKRGYSYSFSDVDPESFFWDQCENHLGGNATANKVVFHHDTVQKPPTNKERTKKEQRKYGADKPRRPTQWELDQEWILEQLNGTAN